MTKSVSKSDVSVGLSRNGLEGEPDLMYVTVRGEVVARMPIGKADGFKPSAWLKMRRPAWENGDYVAVGKDNKELFFATRDRVVEALNNGWEFRPMEDGE